MYPLNEMKGVHLTPTKTNPNGDSQMYDARTKAMMWPTMDQRLLNCAYQLSLNDHMTPEDLANLAEKAKMVPEDYDNPGYLAPLIEIFQRSGHVDCENCGTPHPAELTLDDQDETEKLLRSKGHIELCSCHFR